jgi:hypothetical protein
MEIVIVNDDGIENLGVGLYNILGILCDHFCWTAVLEVYYRS